jgi:hypothetical protein
MTGLQLLGVVAIFGLLDDLVRWMQLPRVPQVQRSGQLRHALVGLAVTAIWGGLWALFARQGDGPPYVPGWLTLFVLVFGLILLGRVLWELRRTIGMPREGASWFRNGL